MFGLFKKKQPTSAAFDIGRDAIDRFGRKQAPFKIAEVSADTPSDLRELFIFSTGLYQLYVLNRLVTKTHGEVGRQDFLNGVNSATSEFGNLPKLFAIFDGCWEQMESVEAKGDQVSFEFVVALNVLTRFPGAPVEVKEGNFTDYFDKLETKTVSALVSRLSAAGKDDHRASASAPA